MTVNSYFKIETANTDYENESESICIMNWASLAVSGERRLGPVIIFPV